MDIIIFVFYSIVLIYILYRLTRKKPILTVTELSLAFLFKVCMGCLDGYIYGHFYNGDDTWMYHNLSLGELQELLHEPALYFTKLLPAGSFAWAGGGFWQG